ncbi:MAG: DUF6263 family protein [Bacillota bacterium]|nr:DUF6263 family protein [Bacillota bacterium]
MKIKILLTSVLIAVFVFSLSACTGGNLALYINVQKGDNYKYHVNSNTTSEVDLNGQSTKSVQKSSTDYTVSVQDVSSDGLMTLNYKFDAFKTDMEANGENQSFDSKNPDESNAMSSVYKNLIGKGFSAKMNKLGEVSEVTGIDSLLDSIMNSVDTKGNSEAKATIDQLKESLKSSFGDKAIISSIQQSSKVFPKGDVKVGDSWETTYSLNSIIAIDITTKYTLDKVDGDTAYVSLKSDYKTNPSKSMDLMGMKMKPDLSGSMTGNIKINIKNGFISSGDMKQELSGKMTVDAGTAGTMEMPMKITTTIDYSTVKE